MSEEVGVVARVLERMAEIELWQATKETIYMVAASTALSILLGFLLAVVMILAHPRGLKPRVGLYRTLDWLVNLGRSFPFLILIISIQPFTRIMTGTTIGSTAAVVPLTIGAIPFVARIIEGCFLEVDRGVVEAARSFGAGNLQIVWRVLVPEALPSLVLNVAVIAITLLGYSAMSGTVGGGGLGDLAVKFGYYRFQPDAILYSVLIMLIMVQAIQSACGFIYRRLR